MIDLQVLRGERISYKFRDGDLDFEVFAEPPNEEKTTLAMKKAGLDFDDANELKVKAGEGKLDMVLAWKGYTDWLSRLCIVEVQGLPTWPNKPTVMTGFGIPILSDEAAATLDRNARMYIGDDLHKRSQPSEEQGNSSEPPPSGVDTETSTETLTEA